MEASAAPRAHRLSPSPRLLGLAGDERLVALIRAGNEGAFEAVYERYHRPLLSFSRHMLGNAEDAAEAVQQTFLSAYRDLTTSKTEIALKAWLFAIARNGCVSMLRARREHADVDVVEPATEGLAVEVQRREDLRELLGDLSRLPEDQRAAIVLAEIGALGHGEIGDVVGCSREKVKALVFQARSSLAASRHARATSCHDIREQLSTLRRGALRRTGLSRHLRECSGCRDFSAEVRRQRQAFAVILPVAPVVGLKEAVLSGTGMAGGAAATTAGAGGAAAGLGALGAKSLAVKALVGAAILGGGTAGGVVVAGLADGGSQVARAPEAAGSAEGPTAGSAEGPTAGAQVSSVAAQGVGSPLSTRPAAAHLPPAARSSRRKGTAPANARGGGHGQKRLLATQPGGRKSSSPTRSGQAHGRRNGGASGQGNTKSEKTHGAPRGNAYGHARAPTRPTLPAPKTKQVPSKPAK